MAKKAIIYALTLSILATPLAACSTNTTTKDNQQQTNATVAKTVAVDFEIQLPNFTKDATPLMLQGYDKDGNILDPIPIEAEQIIDGHAIVYAPETLASVDIIAPINPDGTTYKLESGNIPVDINSVNIIKGTLDDINSQTNDTETTEQNITNDVTDVIKESTEIIESIKDTNTKEKIDKKKEKLSNKNKISYNEDSNKSTSK